MGFAEIVSRRFSTRGFDGRPVEEESLEKILEAGRLAPTAKNLQPQHVFVLQSAQALAKVNTLTRSIYGASTVLLICFDRDECWTNPAKPGFPAGYVDCSIVMTHMMLQAEELGVASCWVGSFLPDELSKVFELPDNLVPVALMPLGYAAPGVGPSERHFSRKPLSETVKYI